MAGGRAKGLRGLGRLRRKLRQLPDDLKAPIRAAFEEGAAKIEADMKAGAPVKTGTLRDNISSKVSADGFSAKIGYRGKRAKKKAFYAPWVEFGTAPHAIGDGQHPGTPAQPYIVPALEKNRTAVMADIKTNINQALKTAAARKVSDD